MLAPEVWWCGVARAALHFGGRSKSPELDSGMGTPVRWVQTPIKQTRESSDPWWWGSGEPRIMVGRISVAGTPGKRKLPKYRLAGWSNSVVGWSFDFYTHVWLTRLRSPNPIWSPKHCQE